MVRSETLDFKKLFKKILLV